MEDQSRGQISGDIGIEGCSNEYHVSLRLSRLGIFSLRLFFTSDPYVLCMFNHKEVHQIHTKDVSCRPYFNQINGMQCSASGGVVGEPDELHCLYFLLSTRAGSIQFDCQDKILVFC
jgi:hypothetical protein